MALQPVSVLTGWLLGRPGTQKIIFVFMVLAATIKLVWWCFRNPKYSVPPVLAVLAFIQWRSGLIFFTVLIGSSLVITFGWLAWLLRSSEIDTWRELIHGLPRLVRFYRAWKPVCIQQGLSSDSATPDLSNLKVSTSGVVATVDTSGIGKDASILKKYEFDIAASYRADRVLFRRTRNWESLVRIDWGAHLRKIYHLADIPESSNSTVWPYNIPFGVSETGKAAEIIANEPIILGGVTGSGKSHTAWSILAGYIRLGVPIKVDVIDWSGTEFASLKKEVGNGIVNSYLGGEDCTEDAANKVFQRFLKAARTRMSVMERRGVRLHIPTVAEPFRLLLVDEGLPLAKNIQKEGSAHPLVTIASQGRKANFIPLFNTQAAQKDVLGLFRDLTSSCISLRTKSRYLTEVVLGEGCEGDGARCSLLDAEYDKGVGYKLQDGHYIAFRSAKVSDNDVLCLARGELPPAVIDPVERQSFPHIVYRLFNKDDELLYVGITHLYRGTPPEKWEVLPESDLAESAAKNRMNEHVAKQPWGDEIASVDVDTDRDVYPNEHLARRAEELAIRTEKPPYNVIHNGGRGIQAFMDRLRGQELSQ